MRVVHLPDSLTEEAVALWHASGLTRPWNDPHADLRRAVAGPCSTVLAALDEEDLLLGTAMGGYDGHRGWVYYLAVRPESERTGLGRTLMQASETWLRARSVPKVNLMVRSTNSAFIAFYKTLGYEDGAVVVLGKFLDE
ncbi:MAG: GNAT family acetyltransferase [Mycobacteriales bacterium]